MQDTATAAHPTQGLDGYQWPTCLCGRTLRNDELDRVTCRICQQRTHENLEALPGRYGLYAQLAAALAPSNSTGDGSRVSGSRTAPLPVRLEPLSLSARGGIVTILQTWLIDWHDLLGWTHPRWRGNLQQQCDQVVQALQNNLEWAAASHPAFGEFATEVAQMVRDCRRQTTGERPERRVTVTCPCGTPLRITLSTPGARCPACTTQHDRVALLNLPLTQRAAA